MTKEEFRYAMENLIYRLSDRIRSDRGFAEEIKQYDPIVAAKIESTCKTLEEIVTHVRSRAEPRR
jgi:hypothetical protein